MRLNNGRVRAVMDMLVRLGYVENTAATICRHGDIERKLMRQIAACRGNLLPGKLLLQT